MTGQRITLRHCTDCERNNNNNMYEKNATALNAIFAFPPCSFVASLGTQRVRSSADEVWLWRIQI
jgi:hypothetical protein